MKPVEELRLPDTVLYTINHEWAERSDGGETVRVGISDYAQDQLGDIVYVDLPELETEFQKNDEFGSIESVKAVSEVYMPISGKVVAVNEDLEDAPELINADPYKSGWIVEIKPSDVSELDQLMNRTQYLKQLQG